MYTWGCAFVYSQSSPTFSNVSSAMDATGKYCIRAVFFFFSLRVDGFFTLLIFVVFAYFYICLCVAERCPVANGEIMCHPGNYSKWFGVEPSNAKYVSSLSIRWQCNCLRFWSKFSQHLASIIEVHVNIFLTFSRSSFTLSSPTPLLNERKMKFY